MKWTMARDQYGETYHNLGAHPRMALLAYFGRKHADKMFIDKKSGPPMHVGYIIAGHWLTLYDVAPWERNAS
jgi:hypothetical protein